VTEKDMAEDVVSTLSGGVTLTRRKWLGLSTDVIRLNKEQCQYFKETAHRRTGYSDVNISGLSAGESCCGVTLVEVQVYSPPPIPGFKSKLSKTLRACSVCGWMSN
jgi:hypothetical protein